MYTLKYINLGLFSFICVISLLNAIRDGEGWWSATMGWAVATIAQFSYILASE